MPYTQRSSLASDIGRADLQVACELERGHLASTKSRVDANRPSRNNENDPRPVEDPDISNRRSSCEALKLLKCTVVFDKEPCTSSICIDRDATAGAYQNPGLIPWVTKDQTIVRLFDSETNRQWQNDDSETCQHGMLQQQFRRYQCRRDIRQ